MKSEPVLIDRIQVVNRLRSEMQEDTVTQIMESIPRVGGLLHPIAIRYVDGFAIDHDVIDGVPVLVAGLHRLEAMKRRGETHIDCIIFDNEIDARLWEISENLHRADLTVLDRSEHEAEWMRLRVTGRQPEHGVQAVLSDGRKAGPQHLESGISLAARELPNTGKTADAKRIHLSRAKRIDEKLTAETKAAVRSAGLANSTTVLIDLAKIEEPEKQLAKVQEVVEQRAQPRPAPTVRADRALELIAGGIIDSLPQATLESPIIDRVAASDADVIAKGIAALDVFLGHLSHMTPGQRRTCLQSRDLTSLIIDYTS